MFKPFLLSLSTPLFYVMVILGSINLQGCGKKVTSEDSKRILEEQSQTILEEQLQKQNVICDNNQPCPGFITKIVITTNKKFKYCTGFLVDSSTVATSANCIPDFLKLEGQNCSRDIFFFFPKTFNRPSERVGCGQVKLISRNEGDNPILWRDDIAFLELSEKISNRREALIVRDGLQNNRQYFSWVVNQEDDYTAIIKKQSCEIIWDSFLNPLSNHESSPGAVFSNCHLENGSSGAPILDSRGRVRGLISQELDPKIRLYLNSTGLLRGALRPISHASNFACAPTPFDNQVLDETECQKEINESLIDQLRGEMLSSEKIFGELKKKYEESLKNLNTPLVVGVRYVSKGEQQVSQIMPRCFKPLTNWLPGFSNSRNTLVVELLIPQRSLRRSMDSFGRIYGEASDLPPKRYFFQFSLKNLRQIKRSSVLMWSSDKPEPVNFPNISENCTSSLF